MNAVHCAILFSWKEVAMYQMLTSTKTQTLGLSKIFGQSMAALDGIKTIATSTLPALYAKWCSQPFEILLKIKWSRAPPFGAAKACAFFFAWGIAGWGSSWGLSQVPYVSIPRFRFINKPSKFRRTFQLVVSVRGREFANQTSSHCQKIKQALNSTLDFSMSADSLLLQRRTNCQLNVNKS